MSPSRPPVKIAISLGDPAGIGPDLAIASSAEASDDIRIYFTDPDLIKERAEEIGLKVEVSELKNIELASSCEPGTLQVYPIKNNNFVRAGQDDPANTEHIIDCLNSALWHTTTGITNALVTGPINKAVINEGGMKFSGHTEYIATALGVSTPVMMLASERLKVVLVTTHIPIDQVTQFITCERISEIANIVNQSFVDLFQIKEPKICICGLNPHAGEQGHIGETDKNIISPTLKKLVHSGLNVIGPMPADSAFSESERKKYDVIMAMYHDQGLAPLKAVSFGRAVNITLGLPIIRTSVDHGTAYELAGTGKADPSSFLEAMKYANLLVSNSGRY